jgi:hypothetical protein
MRVDIPTCNQQKKEDVSEMMVEAGEGGRWPKAKQIRERITPDQFSPLVRGDAHISF